MRAMVFRAWVVSVALAALAPLGVALALDIPKAPSLDNPIVDQSNTLTEGQINTLAEQIANSRKQKDYQLGILIVDSLQGQAIEDYSIKVAREWGIGTKDKNNGVLLLVAKYDRELRIEVGRGLEGDLTDAESSRIIRNTITPQFKKGDYYSGISLGVQNIAAQVEGRPQADTSAKAAGSDLSGFAEGFAFLLFIGFGVLSWFASMLARTKSWWAGGVVGGGVGFVILLASTWALWAIILTVMLVLGGLLLDWAVSRNYANHASRGESASWWAGGPWIGGSGGDSGWGGGSFGGGGFGGGGASGSW